MNRDPCWARPALGALLAATAVLYLVGLGASDWANSYHSAAAQAAGQSWRALFFGALDAPGSITVDKTPASIWVTGLAVRIFGPELVGHPGAAGAHGGGRRGTALRHRPAGLPGRRRAARRDRVRRHPGRGADVPVQQPRRAARAAADRRRPCGEHRRDPARGRHPSGRMVVGPPGAVGEWGEGGRFGGLLGAVEPSAGLVSRVRERSAEFTWAAATAGANNAAGYQLATAAPVMAIGGFNGSDPSPTLAQFQQWVAEGWIHYFLTSGHGLPNGRDNAAQEIEEWVKATFPQVTVDGVELTDLSVPG